MKSTLPLVLIGSLAANAALITAMLVHDPVVSTGTAAASGPTVPPPVRTAAPLPLSDGMLVAAIKTDDPAALRDLLIEADFSQDMIRQIVSAQIWKRHETRLKALMPKPAADAPWWKVSGNDYYGRTTREQREEMRRIQKEIAAETEKLLGPASTPASLWTDTRYAFLPQEKREAIQEIEQDYNELLMEANTGSQGFPLPSDQEKMRFLQEEKLRDIAAILSPEERQAYEMRTSSTAGQLQWQMTNMDATEDEFRRIYELRKTFDEAYGVNGSRDPAYWEARRAAEQKLDEQLKTALGPDRYLDYKLAGDNGYQQLQAATRRFNLPPDTPRRLYSLRDTIPAASAGIAADPSLTADQKRAALAKLAADARMQLQSTLGAEAAGVVLSSGGTFQWISELEKGRTVTFSADGANYQSLPQ